MTSKSDKTRLKIVQTANRLFYRQGYNRTSFTDIVSASGVPRGNIYYYFKTKDEILLATLDYRLDIISGMLEEWDRELRTPVERLKRFVDMLVNSRQSTAEYGCPMGSLNTELGKNQRQLQEAAFALFDRFLEYLSMQFLQIGYGPELCRNYAIELLARGQGLNLMTHVMHDPEILRRSADSMKDWIDDVCVDKKIL
ncbi:MAG: TetR/AcrR family transcriptional regulator [Gammaproteobacteria bacterium]|jgi:AcrR family transcriptional regulator